MSVILFLLALVYLVVAVAFINIFSYECCMTYGRHHYTFLTIAMGLFFPITLIIFVIKWFFLERNES
jgi:hypothetical protein